MTASTTDLSGKSIVSFLRDYLQQLAPLFRSAELTQRALAGTLRDKMNALRYNLPPESPLQAFMLVGCQVIPQLGPESLAYFLSNQSLPPAKFMSEPPMHFDCVLVPAESDVGGSSYIFYFADNLVPSDVYYLLVHAYGHLALGHLRKGDPYSHHDVLSDLQSPLGPRRRWDQAVQAKQHLWFQPLPANDDTAVPEVAPIEWQLAGFAEAFEGLQNNQLDDSALVIQAAASRYGKYLLQVGFDIERDAELFPHQKRGAVELAVRLQKLGVALLADSVGLGKTRTTATLIKLLRQHELIQQAAVLTPGKLEHNWLAELKKLQLQVGIPGDVHADVVIVNKDKFKRLDPTLARQQVRGCDLLIIEEAHQDMRNVDNKFHRNMRDVAAGKYGLLVTATPWNNRRGDIFAMLQPFATTTLGTERPAEAFSCFSKGLKAGQKDFEQDNEAFRQVYNLTTLQRTRRQLRESGDSSVFYAQRRPYLVNVTYTPEQRKAFTTLLDKIEELRLPHFNPVRYLPSADAGENRLSGIHRFVLLKRAESGMYAFSLSLDTLAFKAKSMREELEKVADDEASMAEWLRQRYHLEEEAAADEFDRESTAEVLPVPKIRYTRMGHLIDQAERSGQLRTLRWTLLDNCIHDISIVQAIQRDFQSLFAKDPKLEAILAQINDSIAAGHKVLCISQFADTAQVVYHFLLKQPLLRQKGIGLVMSSAKDRHGPTQINGQSTSRDEVLSRFAPNSWASIDKTKQKSSSKDRHFPNNIAIVVGSDTLSVGQNLQDARVLINLDLCWNPMLHEQRIGRIDRPRHSSDSAPLDIFYFLNLDLIESEIKLRETIEKRLTATYRDTAFDDEILPGYFEMIEEFRRLRREQSADKIYVGEVNAILEDIAERSARPPEVPLLNTELERAALLRLQDSAQTQIDFEKERVTNRLLVSIGQIPLFDQHKLLRSNLPEAALIAEVAFQGVDQRQRPVGKANYRHYYLALHESKEASMGTLDITIESESFVPVVDGLLSDPVLPTFSLSKKYLAQLQALLLKLEEKAQQELEIQRAVLKRAKRYRSLTRSDNWALQKEKQTSVGDDELASTVVASLINARLLV